MEVIVFVVLIAVQLFFVYFFYSMLYRSTKALERIAQSSHQVQTATLKIVKQIKVGQ